MKEINNLEILYKEWIKDYTKIKEVSKKTNFIVLKVLKIILLCFRPFGIVNIFHYYFYSSVKVLLFKPYRSYFTPIATQFQNIQDKLVISSLIILLKLLFYYYVDTPYWILVLIFWRLSEILVVQLSIIFLAKENIIGTVSFPRSILLFIINVSEVITIYAILYLSRGAIGYCYNNQVIQKPFEALYFSIITISTTGFGDIVPINRCGRILVFSEITIGILLLVVFFGIFISRWKK